MLAARSILASVHSMFYSRKAEERFERAALFWLHPSRYLPFRRLFSKERAKAAQKQKSEQR